MIGQKLELSPRHRPVTRTRTEDSDAGALSETNHHQHHDYPTPVSVSRWSDSDNGQSAAQHGFNVALIVRPDP